MEAGYRAMADRSRGGVSLLDVGYVHAKLDDGWQACHSGFNGSSFHGPDGRPLVNKTKFPNITAMTAVAASLGLKPAMYYNNYICHESMPPGGVDGSRYKQMLQGSVDFLFDQGFDGVKIDSGGPFNNMEEWHVAFEETRKRLRPEGEPLFVENCHQGGQEPNASWCPFDIFRTAGDPGVVGWEVEMIQTAAVLNRSYDGCWAYPGYASYAQAIATDANVTGSKGYNDSKTQFSVHSVASSPLVLSFDLNVNNKSHGRSLDTVWSIITNRAAIKINQQWEGSPGALLRLWSPHNPAFPLYAWNAPCDDTSSDPDSAQAGWSHAADGTVRWSGSSDDDATTVQCIVGSKWHHAAIMAPCNASDWQQVFVADADGRLWQKAAPSSAAAARVHRHEQAYRTPASVDAMLTAAAIAGASSDPRVATRDEAIAAQSQSQTWAPRNTQLHDDVNRLVNLLPNLSSRTYGVTGPWLEGQQETYMCSVNRAVSCLPQLSSPWADVRSGALPFYGNARPFPHGSSPARPTITRSAAASAGEVTHEAAHLQRLREIRRIGDAALSYEYT
jgi:hypothetical protein